MLKAVPPLLALLLSTCAAPHRPPSVTKTEPLRSTRATASPPVARPAPPSGPSPEAPVLAGAELPAPDSLKRLDFRGGDPQVPIGLMEGRREVRFSPKGRMRLRFGGD